MIRLDKNKNEDFDMQFNLGEGGVALYKRGDEVIIFFFGSEEINGPLESIRVNMNDLINKVNNENQE